MWLLLVCEAVLGLESQVFVEGEVELIRRYGLG